MFLLSWLGLWNASCFLITRVCKAKVCGWWQKPNEFARKLSQHLMLGWLRPELRDLGPFLSTTFGLILVVYYYQSKNFIAVLSPSQVWIASWVRGATGPAAVW
jgi:hypothetical protein